MRTYLISIALLLLWTSAPTPGWCGKVTSDPNAPGAAKPATTQEADPRLAQKVTYLGGYKRLREVTDDLASVTGVAIKSGYNKLDWRIRDIPLIVCARDVPLGRLLGLIASAAHLELRAERVSDSDDKPTYRFSRGVKTESTISSKLDARVLANLRLAEWAWDALTTYAAAPTPRIPKNELTYSGQEQEIKLVSRSIVSLGPAYKAKALAGESIVLKTGSSAQSALLQEMFSYICTRPVDSDRVPVAPTEQEIRDSVFTITITRAKRADWVPGAFTIMAEGRPYLYGPADERSTTQWGTDVVALAKVAAKADRLGIPPAPDIDAARKAESRLSDPSLEPIEADEDWNRPLLQAKVRVELPKKDHLTRSDIVPALSKASGLSIICEDFASHRQDWVSYVIVPPTSETSVAEVLKGLSPDKKTHAMAWFMDSDSKTLVGWNDDWRMHHRSLVPDNLLSGIREKREGKGAELDDVAPLLSLTDEQDHEWVRATPDFPHGAGYVQSWDKPAWLLYNALDAQDKVLAKSDAGLPLAKLDPKWVNQFWQQIRNEAESWAARQRGSITDQPGTKLLLFSDPELAPGLVMRVKRIPLQFWTVPSIGKDGVLTNLWVKAQPSKLEKHSYVVELTGKKDDAEFRAVAEWYDMQFPLYTFEREAKLAKER